MLQQINKKFRNFKLNEHPKFSCPNKWESIPYGTAKQEKTLNEWIKFSSRP